MIGLLTGSPRWTPLSGIVSLLFAGALCLYGVTSAWTNYASRHNARIIAASPACAISWKTGRRSRTQGEARACDSPLLRQEWDEHASTSLVRGQMLDVHFDDRGGHRHRGRLFVADESWDQHPRGDVIQVAYRPGATPEIEPEGTPAAIVVKLVGWPILFGIIALIELARWRDWARGA